MQSKVDVARRAGTQVDSIHHIIPLEYSHLMGSGYNPNATSNLAGVSNNTHRAINSEWTQFRSNTPNPTSQQVIDKVNEINALYGSQFIK